MSSGHHSIFEDQARELYYLCDEEKKGFITKEDMYRLSSHLPLNPQQFESVFDSLDDDNNGNLTLEEFIIGFSKFLGAPVDIPPDNDDADEEGTMSILAQEHLQHLIEKMKSVGLNEDVDMIKETWNQLQNSNAELLSNFEIIIENIISDMCKAKNEYNTLENVLKSKSTNYDEEIKQLYDELDTQIKTEKERLLNDEKIQDKKVKDELEKEIREKDNLYHEILKNHEQTMKELNTLSNIHSETTQERERLEKERNELEEKLRHNDKQLKDCQEYIEDLNKKAKQDRRNRARAAIEMTEGIALERESLVRQLDELRQINQQLLDEKERKSLNAGNSGSSLDLYKEMNMAQKVEPKIFDVQDHIKKKRGSILSSYFSPPINFNQTRFNDCQSISYDDDEDCLTQTSSSVNNFLYSPISGQENYVINNENSKNLSSKTDRVANYSEIEIQTETETLGERSPPDGAIEESDILIGPEKPERIFKVVLIGDSSVGKTSIIQRFCKNEFQHEGMSSTIGIDFQLKSIRVDKYFIALQIWDTAGQERFRGITSHYYRKADGVVLVYDILSESSLINLRRWMEDVKQVVEDDTVILVLANKCDMIDDEKDKMEANKLANIINTEHILYFQCSAKTGENVTESFQAMAKDLTKKENNDLKVSLKLDDSKKKGCCNR